jgi:hypothetical protein
VPVIDSGHGSGQDTEDQVVGFGENVDVNSKPADLRQRVSILTVWQTPSHDPPAIERFPRSVKSSPFDLL